MAEARERHPQGWVGYPGDVCVHGKYTGGSGVDWMCGPCELGMTEWVDDPRYQLEFHLSEAAGWLPTSVSWRESQVDEAVDKVLEWATRAEVLVPMGVETRAALVERGYWDTPNGE